jgi:hypothetical protein
VPLDAAGLNTAADAWKAAYTWLALFNGDPGGAGTEISGGSPAYARQQVAWGASSQGDASLSGPETFDIPAGATVSHFAYFSASTGGTRGGYGALSASEGPYGAQGTYVVTAATIDFD